jgi:CRISPR-associated protein Csx17
LWDQPALFKEVTYLFAEGRAQIGRRQARNAVEFTLAVSLLGVSRGVTTFSRFGFLKRNGLAFLATPLGRLPVTPRPAARLLDDPHLVEWVDRLRSACRDKEKMPGRYQAVLRQIDRVMFAFANRSEAGDAADRKALLDVLRAIGRAEQTLAMGLPFCKDKYLRPLQGLLPQWLDQANDESVEYRLAASLAGIRGSRAVGSLRVFLEEVEMKGNFANWSPGSTSAMWSRRSVADNLASVFHRRQMEAFRDGQGGVPLYSPRLAHLSDVIDFLNGEIDDEKLGDLLWGLIAIDWPKVIPAQPDQNEPNVPFEFGMLRLLVQPGTIVANGAYWNWSLSDDADSNAKPDPAVFDLLSSGQGNAVGKCIDRAAQRLKSGGLLITGYRNRRLAGKPLGIISAIPANRLLASLLFPLSARDIDNIANVVLFPPEFGD